MSHSPRRNSIAKRNKKKIQRAIAIEYHARFCVIIVLKIHTAAAHLAWATSRTAQIKNLKTTFFDEVGILLAGQKK